VIQLVNLLSARWLLAGEIAVNYLPLLVSFLNGQQIKIDASLLGKTNELPFAIKGTADINTVDRYDLDSPDLPENSIAIIPIQGVMFDYHTQRLSSFLQMAQNNPAINSVLFVVNSPGGMVTQIDLVSDQITNFPKPIISFVQDLNASASAWLTSGSKKIILSSRLNRVGSIGVMTSFTDLWPALEKFGIDHREIYATKSTGKNDTKRTITNPKLSKEDQEKLLIEDLDFVNEIFHSVIIKNRGLSADSEVLDGKIYYAEKGIELGLADEINTIDYALTLAHQLGLENKIKQFYLNQQS
jgi:protease-4